LLLTVALATHRLEAAEPLTDRQMDGVTAGRVTAVSTAEAFAAGTAATTETTNRAIAIRDRFLVVSIKRVNDGLILVTDAREREAEFGFASAQARAEGAEARTRCSTELGFSGPATFTASEAARVIRPGFATCLCAQFGTFVRPN
jgi:hypothetical protein